MVYFIGAGPGDVDLITVKGRELIKAADLVIYAGSLVNNKHMEFCKPGTAIYNSAGMTLDEVITTIKQHHRADKVIVRLHTGDPAIYGAIQEQMAELSKLEIPYQVIPGVSSFTAAASRIPAELTLPGVSQTVILTRVEGRTPVPETEDLEVLARIGASMAIFLSISMIDKVVDKLRKGYGKNVAIAVVERATWEDERVIRGSLDDISAKVKKANITKCAQILVGDFLDSPYDKSLLYDPGFTHMFRQGKDTNDSN